MASLSAPGRRRLRRLLLLGLAAGVGWAVLAGFWVLQAGQAAEAARERLWEVRRGLTVDELVAGDGAARLVPVQRQAARAQTLSRSPVVWPLRWAPVIGRQIRSLEALSGSSAEVLAVAIRASADVRARLDEGADSGPARVHVLHALSADATELLARLDEVDLGPSTALVDDLARTRARLHAELVELRSLLVAARTIADGTAAFLAGDDRYLLLALNNAEMQAGAGMPLAAGALLTLDGRLRLESMAPTAELLLPAGAVEATGDLAARWGWLAPTEDFRQIMLSPRFPPAAEHAARMWEHLGHEPVAGVLAVDPFLLQALLAATGPVEVDGRSIDAGNVIEFVLHDQYLEAPAAAAGNDAGSAARRDLQHRITEAALAALDSRPVDLAELVTKVADAAAGRHVLAWSRDETQQRAWEAAGIDGELPDDALLLSLVNRGANKLDPFLHIRSVLQLEEGPDGTDATMRVTVWNRTPVGEPAYVAGPSPRSALASGTYGGILTATLPGAARGGRIEGVDSLDVAGADGATRVVGELITVPRGGSAEVVFRFRLPPGFDRLTVQPGARQPAVRWEVAGRTWRDARAHVVSW